MLIGDEVRLNKKTVNTRQSSLT